MWCWRRLEKVSRSDRVRNKVVVLCGIKEERNILDTVKGRKDQWFGHTLRKNCLLKPVIEGRIEVTGRRGRRRKKLLDDFKATNGCWILKEEAVDRTVWGTGFGSGGGAVVRLREKGSALRGFHCFRLRHVQQCVGRHYARRGILLSP